MATERNDTSTGAVRERIVERLRTTNPELSKTGAQRLADDSMRRVERAREEREKRSPEPRPRR